MQSLRGIASAAGEILQKLTSSPTRRGPICCGPGSPYDPDARTSFNDNAAWLYAWPSRGGVIVLPDPEAIDFEFLGLNPLDPPEQRLDDQEAEDAFCRKLLHLGAKWWDSEERFYFAGTAGFGEAWPGNKRAVRGDNRFRNVHRPGPTLRERRWVKVGLPSSGGLWVSEFENYAWSDGSGPFDEENEPPQDVGLSIVKMARTMDERCQILKNKLQGKFYQDVKDYQGQAFLNAWDWKTTGEVGQLLSPDGSFEEWKMNGQNPEEYYRKLREIRGIDSSATEQ